MGHKFNFTFDFSFALIGCHTKVNYPSLPNDFSMTRKRIVELIPFLRVQALYEMQIALSSIWTQFGVSISNNDNY